MYLQLLQPWVIIWYTRVRFVNAQLNVYSRAEILKQKREEEALKIVSRKYSPTSIKQPLSKVPIHLCLFYIRPLLNGHFSKSREWYKHFRCSMYQTFYNNLLARAGLREGPTGSFWSQFWKKRSLGAQIPISSINKSPSTPPSPSFPELWVQALPFKKFWIHLCLE